MEKSMTTLGSNATLAERLHAGETIPVDVLIDALEGWEAIKATLDSHGLSTDDASRLDAELDELENAGERCNDSDHCDYDDLKEFFEDCVNSLNVRWPAAEAYDLNLRQVITEAITRGDTVEDAE